MINEHDIMHMAEMEKEEPRLYKLQFVTKPGEEWTDLPSGAKPYNIQIEKVEQLRKQYQNYQYEFRVYGVFE